MPNDPSEPRRLHRHGSQPITGGSGNYGAAKSPFIFVEPDLISNIFPNPTSKTDGHTELLRMQTFLDSTQNKHHAKFWCIDASNVTTASLPDDLTKILRAQFELFFRKDLGGKAVIVYCADGSSFLMLVRALLMGFPENNVRVCISAEHVQQQLTNLRAKFL